MQSAPSSAVAWQPYPTSNFCHVVRGQYRARNCEQHGMSGYKCCVRMHETPLSIINHGRRPSPSTASTATPGSDKATATIVWNSRSMVCSTVQTYAQHLLCVMFYHMFQIVSVPGIHPQDHFLFSDSFCCVSTVPLVDPVTL